MMSIPPVWAQTQGQWTSSGAMQSARTYDAQVKLTNGQVLAIGGVDGTFNPLASAELYNPATGSWKLTGSMTQARQFFPAVLLSTGKVLVSGGGGTGNVVLAEAELFDPATGTWSSAGSLSVARYSHTATLLKSGKVLVTGGCSTYNCSTITAVSELYDPASNTWSLTGSLNTARYLHTAVRLSSGKVLAITGSNGSALDSCELYNPSTGTWTVAGSTNVARFWGTSTLLADGKVLLAGGTQSRYPLNAAEIYTPSTNTWALTGNLVVGTYAHSAALLTDGTVVLSGGNGTSISCGKDCTSYIPTAAAQIYTESSGAFKSTASLSVPRAYHVTTLLTGGKALAAGGVTGNSGTVLNASEYYTPLSVTFSATSLSFGYLEIGLTSPAQTVTVTNVSTHSVTFTSIASNLPDYLESNSCPSTLNAGQNCTITVSFRPTLSGTRNGTVTLADNCPGSSMQTIALTGVGATSAMTLSPNSLSFPGQTPGTSSPPMSITVYNDGSAGVSIARISIAGSGSTYTQTNNCPATLNANSNCVIQVVFTPPDAGTYNATLSVTDSDKSSPQTDSLTGIGLNN
jgi:N-acetylneuraminic acid mutarotase